MSELKKVLENKFGEHRVHDFPLKSEEHIELLEINLELRSPTTLLMTNGLSNYNMPVPEKFKDYKNIELYFCLPSYWEVHKDDEKFNWPYTQIQKLATHLLDKQTWYGAGHTFSNGNPPEAFSETMKQNYLLLAAPIMLEEHLQPVIINNKEVHFLAIVPIYEDEFEYKMGKGYFKFIRKYRAKNNDELLDDFRLSVRKNKFRIF